MSIQQMLKLWGITLSEQNNEYLPEYLLQNHSDKCYFADFFPKKIPKNYAYKYTQIESRMYNLIFDRMYNAILKLWVYDNLYFESNLLSSTMFFKKFIKRRNLLKNMAKNCIEKEQHLRELMHLSKKNIIDLILIFENLHIVIVPSWSCFFVFVEDNSTLPLINTVLSAEGLYLRNASAD